MAGRLIFALVFIAVAVVLIAAQMPDQLNGLAGGTGSGDPFADPEARSLQFANNSATAGDWCLATQVTFGGPTTFEAWILPTKSNGAIFTAASLDSAGAPFNDGIVSFRISQWRVQLYLSGSEIRADSTTDTASLTSFVVSTRDPILSNTWTHVFATVDPSDNGTTNVCVYALQRNSNILNWLCSPVSLAFPEKTRTHLYVGDANIINLDNFNFRGLMENLRIWKEVLGPADILSLSSVSSGDPNVVASWSFDECPAINSPVSSVLDTAGGTATKIPLNCGNGDPSQQPLCVRTNGGFSQAGIETNPPDVPAFGSGNTLPVVTTTPPPAPSTIPTDCPTPGDGSFYGDPHFYVAPNSDAVVNFYGVGWFWIARTEDWDEQEYGIQTFYMACNGDRSCCSGIAWINKRELGWFMNGEQVGLKQDNTSIPFSSPMTTPAGTIITQSGTAISVTVPGYYSFSGDVALFSWSFSFDPSFSGLQPDDTCIPAGQDPLWGQRPVAPSDMYYDGTSPPPCNNCVMPAQLRPPVCPQSLAPGAACDGLEGQACQWNDACTCIAAICWNPALVSEVNRQACLIDSATSESTFEDPSLAVASIDATWQDCLSALDVWLYAAGGGQPDASLYPCANARKCPNWCNGPCQGSCNTATGTCMCAVGYGGQDCSQTVLLTASKRKRQYDAVTDEITASFSSYYDVASFYAYNATAQSATSANPVNAPRSAAFFIHEQIAPPSLIVGNTLSLGAKSVSSFGVVVSSPAAYSGGALAISVKLVDQSSGAPLVGASVTLKDDPSDTYEWDAASASGDFAWSFSSSSGTAGVVIGGLPVGADVCAVVTINAATGIDRFLAVANDRTDYSVPIVTTLPVSAGSSFTLCSAWPADACLAIGDCASCNALAGCGWCASTSTCHAGDAVGPYYTTCTVWRSETDPTVSRLVETLRDASQSGVRTTQLRAYLAPDNAPLGVPVEIRLPASASSLAYQVRGLFEFTDQMTAFAGFLATGGTAIVAGVQQASSGSLFGVSSFRDKAHVRPHGSEGDWVYKEHAPFQRTDASTSAIADEFATWPSSPSLTADYQYDLGLATLEALFHEVQYGWPLHPAPNTKNVVLVFTRSPVALPGILVSAADSATVALGKALPANNLDAVIDDYEDYPALRDTAAVLIERGIVPVFVVPDTLGSEAVVASYRTLVSQLGFGKVWPDPNGRNALQSSMSQAAVSAVISSILSDLATTVQIVASNPAVSSTLAAPTLYNGDNFPAGAVVKVPINLQRVTGASSHKRDDLDSELFRLFYHDIQSVSVMGLGLLQVVSATTDAPSAENVEWSITMGESNSVAHVVTLSSWSVYDQSGIEGYIVQPPGAAGISLYNILPGASPEKRGAPIDSGTGGLITDSLHRVYVDVPASVVGRASNAYLVTSFTYKMVDSCGLESLPATVNIRVVPPGEHAPVRYEPAAEFPRPSVNENTKWAPSSVVVCVGGSDVDPDSSLTASVMRTPANGKLYHIIDAEGTQGAEVQLTDAPVGTTHGYQGAPAVACYVYVPPVRSAGNPKPYGSGYGQFLWRLSDDTGLVSAVYSTSIDVLPVNHPSLSGNNVTVTGYENTPLWVPLVVSDDQRPDGVNNNNNNNNNKVVVAVTIGTFPTHGALSTTEGAALAPSSPSVLLSVINDVPVGVIYTPYANEHSEVDATGGLGVFDLFTYTATATPGGLSLTGSIRIVIKPAVNGGDSNSKDSSNDESESGDIADNDRNDVDNKKEEGSSSAPSSTVIAAVVGSLLGVAVVAALAVVVLRLRRRHHHYASSAVDASSSSKALLL